MLAERNPDGEIALSVDIAETELAPSLPFRVLAPADHFRSRPVDLGEALSLAMRLLTSRIEVAPLEDDR